MNCVGEGVRPGCCLPISVCSSVCLFLKQGVGVVMRVNKHENETEIVLSLFIENLLWALCLNF